MDRRDTVLALLALGAAPFASLAQQAGKVARIGFLSTNRAAAPGILEVFLQYLALTIPPSLLQRAEVIQ